MSTVLAGTYAEIRMEIFHLRNMVVVNIYL
jgi:hypothetical protein